MDTPQLGSARHILFARGVPPCDAVGLAVQLQNIAVSLLLGEKPRVHFLGALDARTLGKELRRDNARERSLPAFGLDVRETRLVSALCPPDMDRKIVLYHFSAFFSHLDPNLALLRAGVGVRRGSDGFYPSPAAFPISAAATVSAFINVFCGAIVRDSPSKADQRIYTA